MDALAILLYCSRERRPLQAREKLPSAWAAHLCIMRIPFRGKLPYNEWENIQGENRNMSIIFFDIDGTVMDLLSLIHI